MKKYPITILCVLFGVFIAFNLSNRETTIATDEHAPCVQVALEDYFEDDLDWKCISNLLISLAEIGCVDGEINGFYWDTEPFHFHTEAPPQYEALDKIVLHYRLKAPVFPKRSPAPPPKEQYDLKGIQEWCKRNQNKYSEIKFGWRVQFNAIREITTMFHNYNIKFGLALPAEDFEARSIEIKLWQPERPMPNQALEPTS